MSSRQASWTPDAISDQRGRIFVITGANSGLGYHMTHQLTRRGARVIMACRDLGKAKQAACSIEKLVPEAELEMVELNLADLSSVRRGAEAILSRHQRLDVLVNNAGVMFLPHAHSVDGFETQMASNHLGHFLWTGLLMPALQRAPASRVVSMSSGFNRFGRLPSDLNDWQRRQSRFIAYCDSKLANLVFIKELARRLQNSGRTTVAVAAHPGYAATNLQFGATREIHSPWMARVHRSVMSLSNLSLAQSAQVGAWPALFAATHEAVVQGGYYGPDGILELRGGPRPARVPGQALSDRDASRMWQLSEQACGQRFDVLPA